MKVYYDNEVDCVYIEFSEHDPEGVVETDEGVNLDISKNGSISGIEILNASEKTDLSTFFSYSLDSESLPKK